MKTGKWLFNSIGIIICSLFFAACSSSKDSISSIESDSAPEISESDSFVQSTEANQLSDKELVTDIDGDKIYPISSDIIDEQKIGDWIYYIKGGEKYKIRTDGSEKIYIPITG